MPRVEFYHIVMVVTAAMMLLVESTHFVMFFVALETVTIGFYILVSYFRDNDLTLEAGLKYLVLGALSSAIMLFGIVLLYGAVGKVMVNGVAHTGFEYGVVAISSGSIRTTSWRRPARCSCSPAWRSRSARFRSKSGFPMFIRAPRRR